MLVTRQNPKTGELVTQSIDISRENLNDIRIDIIKDKKTVLERGRLTNLSTREVVFLYTGILEPLTGTIEQKLEQHFYGIIKIKP